MHRWLMNFTPALLLNDIPDRLLQQKKQRLKLATLPICLLPLVKSSNIVLIILLIEALDFPRIALLQPRSKTWSVVLAKQRTKHLTFPAIQTKSSRGGGSNKEQ